MGWPRVTRKIFPLTTRPSGGTLGARLDTRPSGIRGEGSDFAAGHVKARAGPSDFQAISLDKGTLWC